MTICGFSKNKTIINPVRKLKVSGISNNIIIKAHINDILISGINNNILIQSHVNNMQIYGQGNKIIILELSNNCTVDEILMPGPSHENDINIYTKCSNSESLISFISNKFRIIGNEINIIGINNQIYIYLEIVPILLIIEIIKI